MRRPSRLLPPALALAALGLAWGAVAQIEGSDRGIAPLDSASSYEVGGVAVDVAGKTADAARLGGWRLAQRKAWKLLYARVNGLAPAAAPNLPDGALDGIVAGIVVEDEQIGPKRYIARLGVLFDRARAGRLLGEHGQASRSAPVLVVPVMYSGGALVSLERRNPWQEAWARYRTAGSAVDYVRPVGSGVDPLLLNAAQVRRPGRGWWRMLVDNYGASDTVSPYVSIRRAWPAGPIAATFVARHGPDAVTLGGFDLESRPGESLAQLLARGVAGLDAIYAGALRGGRFAPDPALGIEEEPIEPEEADGAGEELLLLPGGAAGTVFRIEVETPDAAALAAAETALRGVAGAGSVEAQSLALGGTSLIRLTYAGDPTTLAAALAARGYVAEGAGTSLRLRRAAAPAAPPAATPPPAP